QASPPRHRRRPRPRPRYRSEPRGTRAGPVARPHGHPQSGRGSSHSTGTSSSTRVPASLDSMRRAPLIDSARSSIEVIPNFVARNSAAFGSNPFPSSATNRLIMASLELSSTSIRLACECFSALLSASWAIRYTSRSTAGGGRAALLDLDLHGIHAPQDLNVFEQRRNQ